MSDSIKREFHPGDVVILLEPEGGEHFRYGFNGDMAKLCGYPMELGEELPRGSHHPEGFRVYDPFTKNSWSWDVNYIEVYDSSKDVTAEDFNSLFD